MAEADAAIGPYALAIRTAVRDQSAHTANHVLVDRSTGYEIETSGDAAHLELPVM